MVPTSFKNKGNVFHTSCYKKLLLLWSRPRVYDDGRQNFVLKINFYCMPTILGLALHENVKIGKILLKQGWR